MTATAAVASGAYGRLAGLPLRIDGYGLSPLEQPLNPEYTRMTTVVRLQGGGHVGLGEDTTYPMPEQLAFRAAGADLDLAGDWTIDSFSQYVGGLDLFPAGATNPAFRAFRRWAFESAALDLALQQSDLSLASLLGREPRPVRFVVSPGPEPTAGPTLERLALYPSLRLKLMAVPGWDEGAMRELAGTGVVDVVDLKGRYDRRAPVAVPPDGVLYERVLRHFDRAWIEDPGVTAETEPVLRPHAARIVWDAPIATAADIAAQPFPARMINVKPSRSGSLRALLAVYEHCERAGIGMFGGGQFELGPGRAQIQLLAALFHPDAPNDVAPTGYNEPVLRAGLPRSPLPVADRAGFR